MEGTAVLEQEALSAPAQASALAIVDNESYLKAGEFLLAVKAMRAKIDESFDPIIKKQFEAHREAIAQKKKVEAPLAEAEALIKPRIAAWINQQEIARQQEQLRLQKLAQEETERQQLQDASLLHDIGETELANAKLEEHVYTPPVFVAPAVPKIAGITSRETWDFDIVNVNLIPRQYLVVDMVKIRGVVRALKENANIPGVKARKVTGIAGTSKR